MKPGTVVAERFEIEAIAGSGGMGVVFRAVDRASGGSVALKVLRADGATPADTQRFLAEARALSELAHPAIVRYVAHGTTEDQSPYLAMEWLDGEDLERRLRRGALSVDDALAVVRAASEGLAVAHARSIVHRDIKPANLFLADADPRRTKVLDFGIARFGAGARAMTRTGTVLGTAGYMAPEQARGLRDIDARADVFALGCVLYEALSGRPAFTGDHFVAVLAKLLLDEPPPLRDLQPTIPPGVADLATRMLAKDAALRPRDASAVIAALDRLHTSSATPAMATATARASAIGSAELRLVSAILVARTPTAVNAATLPAAVEADETSKIREVADRYGGTFATLVDGTLVLALVGHGSASDQAARAAAVASALVAIMPDSRVALATGQAVTTGRWPVGPVLDRAAAILAGGLHRGEIGVDDLTTRLLEPRYHVSDGVIRGQRADFPVVRTLLGRPTPCVGREKEIALLVSTFDECVDEPASRAIVFIAPPGVGKSRVVHEFVTHVRARGTATVLFARTDPVSAGSALALARQLVLSATAPEALQANDDQGSRIRRRIERLRVRDADRVSVFLCELVGARVGGEPSSALRAARNDAQAMSEWIRRSFQEWLSAECAAQPVLVVIEDLHWGDATSIGYIGEALGVNARGPLMVVGTGRPETTTLFPELWAASNTNVVRLGGLPRRAASTLVREVLGEAYSDGEVARLVDRADGNAFYLEELVRSTAETSAGELPETVMAMVHARLDALEPDARRVLRAASVYGERFWRGAVDGMLGELDAGAWLDALTQRELLVRSQDSRFPPEVEYAFRHGLLREAAYVSLPRSDLAPAHRHAAEWLERSGEREARVLAEHFERGEVPDRAVHWLDRAALTALNGRELKGAARLAERALAFDPPRAVAGRLYVIQAMVGMWTHDFERSQSLAERAASMVKPGSTAWYAAVCGRGYAGAMTGQRGIVSDAARAVLAQAEPVERNGPFANAMYALALAAILSGLDDEAIGLTNRLCSEDEAARSADPGYLGWARLATFTRRLYDAEDRDLGARVRLANEAHSLLDAAGDPGGALIALADRLWIATDCGESEALVPEVRRALDSMRSLGHTSTFDWASLALVRALVYLGRAAEAIETVRGSEKSHHWSDALFAMLHVLAMERCGRFGEAAREARTILGRSSREALAIETSVNVMAHALLARQALREARHETALESAERAIAIARGRPCFASELGAARLVHAEALHAAGRHGDAIDAIRSLRDYVLAAAASVPDAITRAGYLRDRTFTARTLELAAAWCEP